MKKITFLFVFTLLCCNFHFVFSQTERTSLAEWTFDWCAPAVASTTSKTTAVAPDRGTLISTALFSTEDLSATGRGFSWPSSTGYYVYSTNWNSLSPEKYWYIKGLNTLGFKDIQLSSKHSNSSTTPGYSLQLEYRIGGETGTWTKFYGPFDVAKTVTLNKADAVGDGPTPEAPAILPAVCDNQANLEIRYLLTTATQASGVQVRIDAIILTAVQNTASSVDKQEENPVKVFSADGKIHIKGAENLNASIYSSSGALVKKIDNLSSEFEIQMQIKGIYVVNVNGATFKVKI